MPKHYVCQLPPPPGHVTVLENECKFLSRPEEQLERRFRGSGRTESESVAGPCGYGNGASGGLGPGAASASAGIQVSLNACA